MTNEEKLEQAKKLVFVLLEQVPLKTLVRT